MGLSKRHVDRRYVELEIDHAGNLNVNAVAFTRQDIVALIDVLDAVQTAVTASQKYNQTLHRKEGLEDAGNE